MDRTLTFHMRCRRQICTADGYRYAIQPRGGITIVLDRTSGLFGVAFCSLDDNFNRSEGVRQASARLTACQTEPADCQGPTGFGKFVGQIIMPPTRSDIKAITIAVEAMVNQHLRRWHRKLYRAFRHPPLCKQ